MDSENDLVSFEMNLLLNRDRRWVRSSRIGLREAFLIFIIWGDIYGGFRNKVEMTGEGRGLEVGNLHLSRLCLSDGIGGVRLSLL